MKTFFTSLLVCLFALPALAQPAAKNMTLLGSLPFTDQVADVMGYAAPNGTEYAIVGHENGVAFVSLANPAAPVVVQDLPGVNTIWREIDVYQNYAYIVNEGGDGLRIVNLSTLPGTLAYKDTLINGMNTGHTLYIEGNKLYIFGSDIDGSGATVFSLSNPWKPVRLGAYTTRYVHDAYVRNGIAYLSEIYDGFMTMVDMNNPNNPVVLGAVSTPDNFTHNTWLNDAGNVVFTTDEVDAAWVTAYDISNPSNITEIDRIRSSLSNGLAIPHNVKVRNDFIVTAYYKDGVNIIDCDRPHNLIEVGYYDTSPLNGGGFDGVWGLDCYLPSGNIVAADMSEGLFILGPTYVRGCYLEGIVTDASNGNPINNATITIQATPITDNTNGAGAYATGTADAGTYTVTYSAFGYNDSTITVNLANGVLVTANIPLRPVSRINMTINVVQAGTNTPIPGAQVLLKANSGGATLPYTTNGGGIVNDPNFVATTYTVLAGKWGYITRSINYTFSSTVTTLTIELSKGYSDEFALDLGWTNTATSPTGIWERGEPVGTYDQNNQLFNPEVDVTGDIGDECYVTGNGGGGIGDDDVDGGEVVLISPVMDFSTMTDPVIRYYRWFANGGGFGSNINDTLRIEVSNGMSTVVLRRVFGNQNNWVRDTFIVSNFISPTANMRVRFIAKDVPQGHVVEAAIDRFSVIDLSATALDPSVLTPEAALTIAPNPMSGPATVAYDLGTVGEVEGATFEIHDLSGRRIYVRPIEDAAGQFRLDLDVPAGMYLGSIRMGGRVVRSLRISK
jgi:choice-of-anchor B domain-containing protein